MGSQATLGAAVRAARIKEGITLRELARRAGLASSQISRIEKGEIAKPEYRTLKAIAAALGRMSLPLTVLAGPPGAGAEELIQSTWGERETLEAWSGRWLHEELDELLDQVVAGELDDHGAEQLRLYARDLFVNVTVGDHVDNMSFAGELDSYEFEPLVRAWIGLTEERRKIALAFVSEQLALSELDRLGSNPQRLYLVNVELEERGA